MVGHEGFNFCVKYKREIDYDLVKMAKKDCAEYKKYNGCGNCPYSVYTTIVRTDRDIVVYGHKTIKLLAHS